MLCDIHPVELCFPWINHKRELGLKAKRPIPAGTSLYFLSGFLSQAYPLGELEHCLSAVLLPDGETSAAMAGPARLLNSICGARDCSACPLKANCEVRSFPIHHGGHSQFMQLVVVDIDDNIETSAVYVRTIGDISNGEELVVFYGKEWFEKGCVVCGRRGSTDMIQ